MTVNIMEMLIKVKIICQFKLIRMIKLKTIIIANMKELDGPLVLCSWEADLVKSL
jgi:hypothetical protein